MSQDAFQYMSDSANDPARQAFGIVPSDANELSTLPNALLVGTAGVLVIRAVESSTDVTFPVIADQILSIRARFVRATGTTAGSIIGLA